MIKKLSLILFLLTGGILTSQNFKFGKVSKEEILEKQHPLEPEANAAILYNFQRTYYKFQEYSGFRLISEFHQRIKIYNKDGFEWATKAIEVYDRKDEEQIMGLKAVTYNIENGRIEEIKLDRDQIFKEKKNEYRSVTKFTMPAVTEGSVIEIQYKIESPFLGAIDQIPLQRTIPINKTDIIVTIPEYLNFGVYNNPRASFYVDIEKSTTPFSKKFHKTVRSGGVTSTEQRVQKSVLEFNQNTYSINRDNIPSMVRENHVDYLGNYAAFLDWELKFVNFPSKPIENYSNTWEGVSKTIYLDDGYKRELSRTSYFEEEVEALLSGVSNPLSKTQLIFDFVKKKVKWNGFVGYHPEHGLKEAFKEQVGNTGDINLMLVAMLKYANLDANPVMLSTRDNGVPLFPTRSGFNYVLASVQIGGDLILLDATDPYAGLGELPERARNWRGRLIKDEITSSWVNLSPTTYSVDATSMNVRMEEGKISGKLIKNLSGIYAKKHRKENPSLEKLSKNLKENLADVEITGLEVEKLDKPGEAIKEHFDFASNMGQELIGDRIYFKPFFFETNLENPFRAEERQYPVFFDYPSRKHKMVNIMIPEGYELESLPESISHVLLDNAGQFKYQIVQNNRFIRIDMLLEISQYVLPAKDYDAIKKFFNSVIEKQNESIVLRKIKEDGLGKRTESGR